MSDWKENQGGVWNNPSTAEELYQEIDAHLLEDDMPSVYLNRVSHEPPFRRYPFTMLYALKETRQSPQHHPEGSAWNHTMLVVDEAAKVKQDSRSPRVFMWAALLHDIGKPSTTKLRKGRITSYDHDRVGARLAKDFLQVFTSDQLFIQQVCHLIRYHMHILYVQKDLPFADLAGMARDTDIREVALLGLCDRLGRTNYDRDREEAGIRLFLQKSREALSGRTLLPPG